MTHFARYVAYLIVRFVLTIVLTCSATIGFAGSAIVANAQPATAGALTGLWNANDGGTYYFREVGDTLWWVGQSADGGKTWSNVFRGHVSKSGEITGSWADVTRGTSRGDGTLTLHIDASGTISLREQSGTGFGGTVWTRSLLLVPIGPIKKD